MSIEFALAVIFPLALLLCYFIYPYSNNILASSQGQGILKGLPFLFILVAITTPVSYYFFSGYFDYAEPWVANISWAYSKGQPMYNFPDEADQYGNYYGPCTFLINLLPYKLFGGSISVSKLGSIIATVISTILLFLLFKNPKAEFKLPFFILSISLITHMGMTSYWVRPEPLLTLCVIAPLYVFIINPGKWFEIIVLSVSIAIAVNSKITSGFYFLPLIYMFFKKWGFGNLVIAGLFTIVFFVVPFLLPGISWEAFWASLIRMKSYNMFQWELFFKNTTFLLLTGLVTIFAVAYTITTEKKWWKNEAIQELFVVFIAVNLTLTQASRSGSGAYHFIPYFPLIIYFTQKLVNQLSINLRHYFALLGGFCLTYGILACFQVITDLSFMKEREPKYAALVTDTENILHKYGKTYSMGWGCGSDAPFGREIDNIRPMLTFEDKQTLHMDIGFISNSFNAVPALTTEALKSGQTQLWLIPKNEKPFGYFDSSQNQYCFPLSFQNAFTENYHIIEHTSFFDIWAYKTIK